jgi:hypothetical protein
MPLSQFAQEFFDDLRLTVLACQLNCGQDAKDGLPIEGLGVPGMFLKDPFAESLRAEVVLLRYGGTDAVEDKFEGLPTPGIGWGLDRLNARRCEGLA